MLVISGLSLGQVEGRQGRVPEARGQGPGASAGGASAGAEAHQGVVEYL